MSLRTYRRRSREWVPLEEVIGAALNRRELGTESARVRAHLPADLPLVALDPVLMEQVVVNLVDNALKYSPPGSPVDIKAWAAGKSLTLSVADQGPGLAPGKEDRIFEKFFRGEAAPGHPGAGLGLAICRGIVAAHGGRIQAVNHPQGGAQFLVSLPLDLARRQVLVEGREIHLTPIEYRLFTTLIRHAGKVVTQRQLLKEVWGGVAGAQPLYLRVYMAQLRHKLEEDPSRPRYLRTEPGVGFRLLSKKAIN